MEQQQIEVTTFKYHVYLSTLIMFTGFQFLIAIIAMIKEPLKVQANLSQVFLGALDAILFIGSAVGYLYLAFYPVKRPVLTSFVFCILIIILLQLQLLINVFPDFTYEILIVTRFVLGILTILPIIVITIVNHYLFREQDQKWMQIWFSIGVLGQVIGVLFCKLLMQNLQLDWGLTITLCCPFFALAAIYALISCQEIPLEEQNSGQESQNTLQSFKVQTVQYFGHKSNILQGFIFILITSVLFLALLWLPYFFKNLGGKDSVLLSISYAISYTFGTLLLAPSWVRQYTNYQILFRHFLTQLQTITIKSQNSHRLGSIFLASMIGSTLLLFITWFLGDDPSEMISYMILISLSTILMSGFSSFTTTTDLRNSTRNNRQFMIINSLLRFFVRVFQAFNFTISGYLVSKQLNGFIKYITVLMFIYRHHFIIDNKQQKYKNSSQNTIVCQIPLSNTYNTVNLELLKERLIEEKVWPNKTSTLAIHIDVCLGCTCYQQFSSCLTEKELAKFFSNLQSLLSCSSKLITWFFYYSVKIHLVD